MYLRRIELHGFKSFADKSTIELEPGLTAIVGPNGSGKSNISDAVRWVLGEQSTKSLRGEASADMIFAGSRKRTRMGKATVSLVLDNASGTAPLEYPEIVLTRKLSRSGESEYLINKAVVRLADILLFLARANFGQKSYAVVGQGSVEQILRATPEMRKSYFDEAVGVKEFQLKRDSSLNKLRRTEEHLEEAGRLIEEIEPRLRTLTRQVKRLERRETFEKELLDLQSEYYGAIWKGLELKLADQQKLSKQLNGDKQSLEQHLQKFERESERLAMGSGNEHEFTDLQSKLAYLEEQRNHLVRDQVVLRGQLELEHQKRGGQEEAWLVRRKTELEERLRETEHDAAALPSAISALEQGIQDLEQQHVHNADQLKDAEYALLKIERDAHEGQEVSISGIRDAFTKLHHEHKAFVGRLLKAHDLDTIRALQIEAKTLLSEYASLLSQMEPSSKQRAPNADAERLRVTMQGLSRERDRLLAAITTSRIELSRTRDRSQYLSRTLEEVKRELREVSAKFSHHTAGHPASAASHIQKEHARLQTEIDAIDHTIATHRTKLQTLHARQQEAKSALFAFQQKIRATQDQLNVVVQQLNNANVETARLETRRDDIEQEIRHEPIHAHRERITGFRKRDESIQLSELDGRIQHIKHQLELIGGIEPETLDEYKQTKERYEFLTTERADLEHALSQLHQIIEELDQTIKVRFQEAFKQINKDFHRYFQVLFGGGRASLELLHEIDQPEILDAESTAVVEDGTENATLASSVADRDGAKKSHGGSRRKVISGIEIDAQPPGKKLQTLSALSGGEKALTSIALLCAIIHNNPSPFVILDEVEAALDEANSERFANIVEDLAKKTQFIIVTHNRATMSKADVLYGVSMGEEGVSKLLSVKLQDLSDKMIGK